MYKGLVGGEGHFAMFLRVSVVHATPLCSGPDKIPWWASCGPWAMFWRPPDDVVGVAIATCIKGSF